MVPPAGPPSRDQVMAWFVVPETVAVKATVWQASRAAEDGGRDGDLAAAGAAGAVTVHRGDLDLRGVGVARRHHVDTSPRQRGAWYTPDAVTEPPAAPSCTDQVTPVSAEPVTEAVNVMEPPGAYLGGEGRQADDDGGRASAGPVGPVVPEADEAVPRRPRWRRGWQ